MTLVHVDNYPGRDRPEVVCFKCGSPTGLTVTGSGRFACRQFCGRPKVGLLVGEATGPTAATGGKGRIVARPQVVTAPAGGGAPARGLTQ